MLSKVIALAIFMASIQAFTIKISPKAKNPNIGFRSQKTSGLIFLHGLGSPAPAPELGLSMLRTKISAPKAPNQPVGIYGNAVVRSWFNFWQMPGVSVTSPNVSESKEDLERAMKWVEGEIEKMIQEGIPSENIVLMGGSQGGALTLYTALHTKYKIGGFIPLVAWQPLLMIEPPSSLPVPANKDTPIFHMNGALDSIVPLICGWKTSAAFEQVFTRYELKNVMSTHNPITPLTIPKIYCWLKNNVPGMAFSNVSPLSSLPCY